MSQHFHFKSLDHVTLIVADLERSGKFYRDILGMTELLRPEFDFDGAWFATTSADDKTGGSGPVRAQIHLTLAGDLAGEAGWGERNVGRLSRGHHIAFQVNDASAAAESIARRGAAIDVGPQSRPDGPTQIFLRDPDGHVIELFSLNSD